MHGMNDENKAQCRPADVNFSPETMASLWLLRQDSLLFIVINPAGVAEGALPYAEVGDVSNHVVKQLANVGVTIAEIDWCPHKQSGHCMCVKPNPYSWLQAEEEHHGA
jgi:histidinol phosphatase-like enzyme